MQMTATDASESPSRARGTIMTIQVIEGTFNLDYPRHAGRMDTTVGGVITKEAVINVVVAGSPAIIEIVIEERLTEGEGLGDTLRNIASDGHTFAGIGLDYAGATGLVRLLNRAIALCTTPGHLLAGDEVLHGGSEMR